MRRVYLLFSCIIMLLLFSSIYVNAVTQINPQEQQTKQKTEENKALAVTILTILFIAGIIFIFAVVFMWVCVKIFQKLSEYFYKKKGAYYELFINNLAQCRYNYDAKLKRRLKRYIWLFWRRQPIFIKKYNDETEIIGQYEGECFKREGFYFLAIRNKITIFKSISRIIIIPIEAYKEVVHKIDLNRKRIITLNCDGIDNILFSDFYAIPLLKRDKTDKDYINFSNQVFDNYLKVEMYQDIIAEQLLKYRSNMIKNVESEPKIHRERRTEK